MARTVVFGCALVALVLGVAVVVGCSTSGALGGIGGGGGIISGGDAAAGQTLYDNNCAACHRLGSYDSSGSAPDLGTRAAQISVSWVRSHRGLTFSEANVADLQAFVLSQ